MCCEGSGEQTYHRIAQDWRRYSDQYKMQREAGHRYSYCAADVEVVTCVGVGAGVEARLQVTLRKGPWVRTGMWGICPQGRCDSSLGVNSAQRTYAAQSAIIAGHGLPQVCSRVRDLERLPVMGLQLWRPR